MCGALALHCVKRIPGFPDNDSPEPWLLAAAHKESQLRRAHNLFLLLARVLFPSVHVVLVSK
jgi:nitrate reductase NapE component